MRAPGTFSRCAVGLSLVLLASCNSAPQNGKAVAQDATGNSEDAASIRQDADTRADRLDEAAGSLDVDSKRIGGAASRALNSEAKSDVAAAETVRREGDRDADNVDGATGAPIAAADGKKGTGR
jgi:hypothetical protein